MNTIAAGQVRVVTGLLYNFIIRGTRSHLFVGTNFVIEGIYKYNALYCDIILLDGTRAIASIKIVLDNSEPVDNI